MCYKIVIVKLLSGLIPKSVARISKEIKKKNKYISVRSIFEYITKSNNKLSMLIMLHLCDNVWTKNLKTGLPDYYHLYEDIFHLVFFYSFIAKLITIYKLVSDKSEKYLSVGIFGNLLDNCWRLNVVCFLPTKLLKPEIFTKNTVFHSRLS